MDGVSSTRPIDRTTALQRLTQHGAFMSSSEMALFQLMRSSKSPHFKVRHAPAVCWHATSSHSPLWAIFLTGGERAGQGASTAAAAVGLVVMPSDALKYLLSESKCQGGLWRLWQ